MSPKFLIQLYFFLFILTASTAFGKQELGGEVLAEINLARTTPQAYVGYLREFRRRFQGKSYRLAGSRVLVMTREGVKAVDEAIHVLSRLKPLPPLSWSDGLAAAATDLADEQAATGDSGHDGQKSGGMRRRIERHGEWQGEIAENIGYGPAEARLMVLQLIVDDGVLDRGHRNNIFRRTFAMAGVACGPHPTYGHMCVIDFAGGFKEN